MEVQIYAFIRKDIVLQLKDLMVSQPYIEITQKNLIENSVQDCLPCIPRLMVCATTTIDLL